MWEFVKGQEYTFVRSVREYVRGCSERIFGKDCGRIGGFVFCKNKIKKRLRSNLIVIKKKRFRKLIL